MAVAELEAENWRSLTWQVINRWHLIMSSPTGLIGAESLDLAAAGREQKERMHGRSNT